MRPAGHHPGVDRPVVRSAQNSTVVFPSPLMSAIDESGHFLAREREAATTLPAPSTATTHVEDAEAQ